MFRAFPWTKLTTACLTSVLTRRRELLRGRRAARAPSPASRRRDPAGLGYRLLRSGRGGDKQIEQRPVRVQTLGVPLDADDDPVAGALDGLDRPILRPRGRDQSLPERAHGLVVERVDLQRRASERRAQAALRR